MSNNQVDGPSQTATDPEPGPPAPWVCAMHWRPGTAGCKELTKANTAANVVLLIGPHQQLLSRPALSHQICCSLLADQVKQQRKLSVDHDIPAIRRTVCPAPLRQSRLQLLCSPPHWQAVLPQLAYRPTCRKQYAAGKCLEGRERAMFKASKQLYRATPNNQGSVARPDGGACISSHVNACPLAQSITIAHTRYLTTDLLH